MKQLTLGSLAAAVAMFIWGSIFWANPLPYTMLQQAPDDAAAGQALLAEFPETGTYLVPGLDHEPDILNDLHTGGPVAMLFIRREGANPMSASVFIGGFLHMLITAFLIALLLRGVVSALPHYKQRLLFVLAAGVTVAVWSNLGMPVWWHQPWTFHLLTAVYDVGAWLAAGAVLAYFIQPVRTPATA